jgi:endonuclease-3
MGPRQPRWVKSGKAPGKQQPGQAHSAPGLQHSAKPAFATRRPPTKTKASADATSKPATGGDNGKAQRAATAQAPSSKPKNQNPKLASANSNLVAPPKSYKPTSPGRVTDILKRLDERYGNVTCALHHNSAWELLVATILSAQCTDARVNMVTPVLFKKYPTVQDVAALTPEELEPDIKSTGFFRNKSKSIVGAAKKIMSDFGGQVPNTLERLITIPGAARKTANVVLGSWFNKAEGVVVDTHVHRISRRLELTKEDDPVKIEQDLMKVIPRDRWILFSHQIIHHGRALCVARMPKCAECPLEAICHAADKTWSTVPMHKGAL